jgi:hypothetical protein
MEISFDPPALANRNRKRSHFFSCDMRWSNGLELAFGAENMAG